MSQLLRFHILLFPLFLLLLSSCERPEVLDDLEGTSFRLVNQDSASVTFPGDYRGDIQVISFIYTHCPDVCPIITANMTNIIRNLEEPENVHFIEISFDPERDTPAVLNDYMKSFKLNPNRFTMLTGEPAVVDSLLDRLGIFTQITNVDTTDSGRRTYLMNHSNKILLMDQEGRIRGSYNGSRVPPAHVIEDINKLR